MIDDKVQKEGEESGAISSPISRLDYYYRVGRSLAVLLLVVALGLLAVNQALEYRYKAEFLKTPCQLCKDLNKNMSGCIDNCFKYRVELFADGLGNWKDNLGNCYTAGGMLTACIKENKTTEPFNIRLD